MKSKEIIKILMNYLYAMNRMAVINNFFSGQINGEADVLSLSNSFYVYEYEVKISRSDFFADFKKRFKHSILKREDWVGAHKNRIANYFYYVVPENLISVEEVPQYAGLIYVADKEIKTIKEAPKIHKEKANEKLLKSLLKNFTYKLIIKSQEEE